MGDQNAPERRWRATTTGSVRAVPMFSGPPLEPGESVEVVDAAAYDRVVAERDEAQDDSEEVKAIDEVLDDHLVPQLDESKTPVGGALRVELLVRERDMAREDYSAWKAQADDYGRELAEERARADRYREALVGLRDVARKADRTSSWLVRERVDAALAEGEQPAGDECSLCDGYGCAACANTGSASRPAAGEQPAGEDERAQYPEMTFLSRLPEGWETVPDGLHGLIAVQAWSTTAGWSLAEDAHLAREMNYDRDVRFKAPPELIEQARKVKAAGEQSTTETGGDDPRVTAMVNALTAYQPPSYGTGPRTPAEDRAVVALANLEMAGWQLSPSTTETATDHEYSLLDAVFPTEGARRLAQIAAVRGAITDYTEIRPSGAMCALVLDALRRDAFRAAAAPATPEGPDAA